MQSAFSGCAAFFEAYDPAQTGFRVVGRSGGNGDDGNAGIRGADPAGAAALHARADADVDAHEIAHVRIVRCRRHPERDQGRARRQLCGRRERRLQTGIKIGEAREAARGREPRPGRDRGHEPAGRRVGLPRGADTVHEDDPAREHADDSDAHAHRFVDDVVRPGEIVREVAPERCGAGREGGLGLVEYGPRRLVDARFDAGPKREPGRRLRGATRARVEHRQRDGEREGERDADGSAASKASHAARFQVPRGRPLAPACQGVGTAACDISDVEFVGTRRVYAAGDLVDYLACGHVATLAHAVASGERERPAPTEEERLVARKGDAHEAAYLARLRASGIDVVEVARAGTFEGRRSAARATLDAMRRGAEAIHGATFVELPAAGEGWLGVADFAIRTEGPSQFGDYHYEIWDAKLARTAKPSAIVQMCVYSDLLARVQGVMPARVHAILGNGRIESYRTDDALPYVRAARTRFVERMRSEAVTYPDPVAACARCRWSDSVCEPRRRADDHLSLIANVRRSQIVKLHASGIATSSALVAAPDGARPRKLDRTTFERVRAQAALQAAARADGIARYDLLKPHDGSGFARLPEPDPGDLYFDMEGDPFYDGGGLEYLFGVASVDAAGERRFDSFDGHDRSGEKRAFEAFVDFVFARRAVRPNLHVYHYASYEESALKRLASQHATREREVDILLREEVLVDLFDVVRQSLRASFESYSLKKIEQFYRGHRLDEVTSAIGSVVMYERYLETRDPRELEEIVRYNREDCYSTLDLHRWLLERRAEAEARFDVAIPFRAVAEAKAPVEDDDLEGLSASLAAGIDFETATADERARYLAAQLLVYHRREAKPAWWAFFDRFDRPEELVDDGDAIGELTVLDGQPELFKRSQIFTLAFPPQEHKLKPGTVYDPALGPNRAAGTLLSVDDERGLLRLKRGPSHADAALPRALMPDKPIQNDAQRAALARFGRELLKDGCASRFTAGRDLLRGDGPRLVDRIAGAALDDGATTPDKLAGLALALDGSYLFVQGPPGAGKTFAGARAIVTLLQRGLRVGVASSSHKAIHNLLAEIERVAESRNFAFAGLKKSSTPDSDYTSVTGAIRTTSDTSACCVPGDATLVAGTAWLFSDERMSESLDVLAIDEAGQVSLADAIAMSTAAKNVLLLGDPMQLAQVAQGQHPAGAGASVLTHLLGDRATVLPSRGVFLPHSYRMHENVCRFVSALAYDGRLHADPSCAHRRIDAGTIAGAGLRYLPVAHEGNVQSSIEEADAIADALDDLLVAGTVTDERGASVALTERHVLVVTPYNAQVRRIRGVLTRRGFPNVRVGTVDKFQGQEAPVVFFSMASSRGDEVPRGVDFLFDRHRLNVAISRAQALAVLVCSPALLETQATTIAHLGTIGALCRFVRDAAPLRGPYGALPEQLSLTSV